jgi:hypothetical protein
MNQNPLPWTDENKVAAFNATLRRSVSDREFRTRLLDKHDARNAVAEEGNVEIPAETVIRFYEKKEHTDDVYCVELPPLDDPSEPPKQFADSVYCTYSTWAK